MPPAPSPLLLSGDAAARALAAWVRAEPRKKIIRRAHAVVASSPWGDLRKTQGMALSELSYTH